ncbi:MAG: isoleucine--tRNA ligase [Planctomycetes bacterium]|nr:isoleucine--tRNA ligase [Planctomycetota bacterium]
MTESLFAPLPDDLTAKPDAAEAEVLAAWRANDTFGALQRTRAGAPSFVFWEGPPTANGRPGIHHVLARTIKDAVCRWQTMNGKRVVRKAGWDTHGLPVELEVEKKLGISGKPDIERYGVAAFNKQCRESVWTYQKDWEQLSERIGYWLDYSDPYITYAEDYVESVWSLLARFHGAGLVYRGKKVLPYCGRCGTGLSSHELGQPGVYRDVQDPSVTVRFRLKVQRDAAEPESVLAWTTTPWTLPSNFALAVHPELDYVRVRVRHMTGKGADAKEVFRETVWVAAARADAVLPKGFEVLETRKGKALLGLDYEPLFVAQPGTALLPPSAPADAVQRRHKLVSGDFVTTTDGTGVVHMACYGADDWDVASKHGIAAILGPGPNGTYLHDVRTAADAVVVAAGTWFKDADELVVNDLKARHLMFKYARESHSYPHCWRCNTALYYFPVDAWYIKTTAYKDRMVELNRKIRWVPPEVGEKRFGEWLANNVDWNISRDRYWGTPLPFWVCEKDETHVVAIGGVAELTRRAGKLPEGFDNHKPLIDEVVFPCDRCSGTMRRTKSVLDCWFDSGAMPYAQYHWPFEDGVAKVRDQFPADFIAEGLDQTRGWFYTLHAIGAFVTTLPEFGASAQPAYKTCVVNGLVLDKDGVKMSKRLGNVVDPWKAIAENGADAVRWYLVANGQPWLPKRFDPAGLVEVRRKHFGTLVNSYKFLADYARIDRFDPTSPAIPPVAQRPEIDRWLASRTESLVADVRARMDDYDLAEACRAIEDFVADDVSNWYIRRNRRRFWLAETGADKLAAFATLHHALTTVALLGAPFAPFLSEMLWTRLASGKGSVHAERAPTARKERSDADLETSMRIVKRVVVLGRALRERLGIKNRQPLSALHVRTSDERALALLGREFARDLVLGELNVKRLASLAADDGRLCTLKAKANFKVLGKRLGASMKAAAAAIEALPSDRVAQLRAGARIALVVDGANVELGPEDVLVQVETRADFELETDGQYVVWFETELDDELVQEGLARECVNRLNALRKDRGLAPEDRIRLVVWSDDTTIRAAVERFARMIANETLAVELAVRELRPGQSEVELLDLGEGRVLLVQLARA